MAALVLLAPFVLVAVVGAVGIAVGAATSVRSRRLPPNVATARRHAVATASLAVAAAAVGGALVVVAAPAGGWRPGVGLAVVPLAATCAHTAVLLGGELTWPRPHGSIRRAVLRARTVRDVAPRRLLWLVRGGAGLVVLLAVTGWATADERGGTVSRTVHLRSGEVIGALSAGTYPGRSDAVPTLVAVAVVVALVEVTLRVVATRPAVDGAAGDEQALRAASAHRVLRGAFAGVSTTAGGWLLVGGTAVQSLARPLEWGVDGVSHSTGALPQLTAVGVAAVLGGVVCLGWALVVALTPAPRIVRPDTDGRGAGDALAVR